MKELIANQTTHFTRSELVQPDHRSECLQVWGDWKQVGALGELEGLQDIPGSLWLLGRNLFISDLFHSATQFGKRT